MEETLEGTFAMIKPDAVGKKTLPYKNRTSSELEEVTARDRSKT